MRKGQWKLAARQISGSLIRGSDLCEIGIEAEKVAQDIHFAAERADVLADEVESDLAGAAGG